MAAGAGAGNVGIAPGDVGPKVFLWVSESKPDAEGPGEYAPGPRWLTAILGDAGWLTLREPGGNDITSGLSRGHLDGPSMVWSADLLSVPIICSSSRRRLS